MSKWWPHIEDDLNWRFDELAEIRQRVVGEDPDDENEPQSKAYVALLRSAWAMLYAHYEGFCIFALSLFLEENEDMNVLREDCRQELVRYSLQHHLPKARNSAEADFIKFLQSGFNELLASGIDFPRDEKLKDEYDLKGRSNLWPKLLAECLALCCIPCAAVAATDTRLKLLVARRNDIAHGKDTPVKDHKEYVEYEEHVTGVMRRVGEAVDYALLNCLYLNQGVRHHALEELAHKVWRQTGGAELENWFEALNRLANGERA